MVKWGFVLDGAAFLNMTRVEVSKELRLCVNKSEELSMECMKHVADRSTLHAHMVLKDLEELYLDFRHVMDEDSHHSYGPWVESKVVKAAYNRVRWHYNMCKKACSFLSVSSEFSDA